MDRLWAPWRMQYIKGIDKQEHGCVFCLKSDNSKDQENLILYRGTHCFVLMNLYPYNNGHLMIIPYLHTSDLAQLDKETTFELWECLGRAQRALSDAFCPDAFNIGMNIGRAAGAGIDQHIHMHIVPRWNGDTNFISIIGDTKVISQGLNETYAALLPYFRNEVPSLEKRK